MDHVASLSPCCRWEESGKRETYSVEDDKFLVRCEYKAISKNLKSGYVSSHGVRPGLNRFTQ